MLMAQYYKSVDICKFIVTTTSNFSRKSRQKIQYNVYSSTIYNMRTTMASDNPEIISRKLGA